MKIWIILTIIYALFTGFFEFSKKQAVNKNSIYEVLAFFSTISFLFIAFTTKDAFEIEKVYLLGILLKSVVVLIAWILGLYAIDKMPVSLYGLIRVSRVVFSILMSIILLGEKINLTTLIGIIIVIIGLILVNNTSNNKKNRETSLKIVVILLISCLLNSISAIIDKQILMNITSSQLQFWFILFLTIGYWLILILRKHKIDFRKTRENYWIPLAALCFVLGDRCLFIANEIPDSKVSIMTLLKQITTIELILIGKFAYKEKNIKKKLIYSILIIFGIILTLI